MTALVFDSRQFRRQPLSHNKTGSLALALSLLCILLNGAGRIRRPLERPFRVLQVKLFQPPHRYEVAREWMEIGLFGQGCIEHFIARDGGPING